MLEALAFPNGKYDDQVDALSQFLNWRTEAERMAPFSFDFGNDNGHDGSSGAAVLVAPSPDEMLWRRGY